MTQDELRNLERSRRKALWALANLHPGDPDASEPLTILDYLDTKERSSASSTNTAIDLREIRDVAPVLRHRSGIDIVLERDIPQPWRERFLQASVGSTRIADGPYATDWDKFLTAWEQEMAHLQQHRATRHPPVTG
ncbi:hypothetical protein [Pseudomonas syringae]|uniref:hypothetical protein n=1 Tax=Pseudomonas syringae TaxID=317 RepID=UPI0018E63D72|nr:hypothetical protein [Pseudomonas syringae]MBI6750757.1 hypothetical protein [Pseudomonas syringae]MBI6770540.1 hypothetical protein [Pseudomonas syringae]MBI6774092.1 hypothetical protein [Pseudomonas syringae]MBI6790878.1 hypothetical protein [Pseudomonas syringae]MBI6803721.1 hypothetical protein [Pseudomonas syringae]